MAENSAIGWTEATWNPWRGCTKISPGCANCYMFAAQDRYGRDPKQVVRTKTWGDPLKWQRAAEAAGRQTMVFTCSWSDWFHEDANPWRNEAWDIVRRCPNLIFQILTKRPERIVDHLPHDWGHGYLNTWLGVSVESRKYVDRALILGSIPAAVRFVSVEPLLGYIGSWGYCEGCCAHSDIAGRCLCADKGRRISWVIVGGESGPNHRPCDPAWVESIVRQCREAGVSCYVKQDSGPRPGMQGRLTDEAWAVKEFPVLTREKTQ